MAEASGYVGEGANRWAGVHVRDAARLFRLALEHGAAGASYHGVADEGVAFREIAQVIARRLNVTAAPATPAEATRRSAGWPRSWLPTTRSPAPGPRRRWAGRRQSRASWLISIGRRISAGRMAGCTCLVRARPGGHCCVD